MNKTFVSVRLKLRLLCKLGRARQSRHSTYIFGKISYVLMVRVKISCFYQELDLECSLYRLKVCLGVLTLWKKSLM